MRVLVLAVLLVAPAALAERCWTVEPGQALVTVDAAGASAFSHRMTGTLTELDNKLVHLELHLPLGSLTTGSVRRDERVPREGEAVFDGVAEAREGRLLFVGTVQLHGVKRAVQLDVAVTRTEGMIYAHATSTLHLRDFGIDVAHDQARIELDAGLRRRGVVAIRG
jgi:polyisoprenoid-binding protein YceI